LERLLHRRALPDGSGKNESGRPARTPLTACPPSAVDTFVLRVAYFFVDAPAGDLDNIVKPIQDALKGIAYADDKQVVDLVASMRRKGFSEDVPTTAVLSAGFGGGSDFIYVVVEQSSGIEVFR
jgi:crossover junction endodeoxyribonuclease RusA